MKNDALIERLLRYRKQVGVSQDFVGRMLGIDSRTVSRWERGLSKPTNLGRAALNDFLRTRGY